jgi:rhodanese-related sulfurtransferase
MDESWEITPAELKKRRDQGEDLVLLDVREPDEIAYVNIGGIRIPMEEIVTRAQELDKDKEIVVICHHGVRSAKVVSYLRHLGFSKARNLKGGIAQWTEDVDPYLPRY